MIDLVYVYLTRLTFLVKKAVLPCRIMEPVLLRICFSHTVFPVDCFEFVFINNENIQLFCQSVIAKDSFEYSFFVHIKNSLCPNLVFYFGLNVWRE